MTINKGIILAGGTGSRLYPLTKIINKHLLPVNEKPMIYYSISILMLSNIRNIEIVVNKKDVKNFKDILGNTKELGINITFKIQKKPEGIGHVFKLCKNFIKKQSFVLILGDNFFYGQALSDNLNQIQIKKKGCQIFTYPVKNTQDYGILEKNKIKEKPKKTSSNLAVTGLYVFDNQASYFFKKIKKSKRGEYEIIDVINQYIKKNQVTINNFGRGAFWFDMGTYKNLVSINNLVNLIEEKQRIKIACLEEIALKKGWMKKNSLLKRIAFYGHNHPISLYLKEL